MHVSIIAFIVLGTIFVHPKEAETIPLDELRERADLVLSNPGPSARGDIDVVFELVDALLEEGSDDAEHYLLQGLKHFPWNLEYQMAYAELLAKEGRSAEAEEKAGLVLRHAESDDLVERAGELLGREPLPAFDGIESLPGSNHCLVLIPFQEADAWLVARVRERLSVELGIPVYVQTVETDYPPFDRDRRKKILIETRWGIEEEIDNPRIAQALKDTNLTLEELDDETDLLRFMKTLLDRADPEAFAEFETVLEESRDKDPQWHTDQLLEVLFETVGPYRRENVVYLGITPVDIYASDHNFLFGWASDPGGVVSYHRFTAEFNDETPNQERLVKRTLMQCLSSTRIANGIERCTNPTCACAYPNSLPEHDAKEGTLCLQCKSAFEEVFGQSATDNVPGAAPEE